MKLLGKYLIIFILVMGLGLPVLANDLEDITNVMKEKVHETISILQDPTLLRCEKKVKISKIDVGMFDHTLMSKLSIGKKNWSKFTPKQKKEFVKLFTLRMKESYIEKAQLLTDEKVIVHDAIQVKPTRIYLNVEIQGSETNTNMLYKYYKTKQNKWLIYDVEIAKISILQTYRAQFAEKLNNSSVEDLLEQLRVSKLEKSS
jgi:phospholipid transport system substrate-binding protein